jgi:hypothetical protein
MCLKKKLAKTPPEMRLEVSARRCRNMQGLSSKNIVLQGQRDHLFLFLFPIAVPVPGL